MSLSAPVNDVVGNIAPDPSQASRSTCDGSCTGPARIMVSTSQAARLAARTEAIAQQARPGAGCRCCRLSVMPKPPDAASARRRASGAEPGGVRSVFAAKSSGQPASSPGGSQRARETAVPGVGGAIRTAPPSLLALQARESRLLVPIRRWRRLQAPGPVGRYVADVFPFDRSNRPAPQLSGAQPPARSGGSGDGGGRALWPTRPRVLMAS